MMKVDKITRNNLHDFEVFSNSIVMRFFFKGGNWLVTIKFFSLLWGSYFLCLAASCYEQTLFSSNNVDVGFISDIPIHAKTVLYSIGLFYVQKMFGKVKPAFLGSEKKLKKSSGLLHAVNIDGYENTYRDHIADIFNIIEANVKGWRVVIYIFYLSALTWLVTYYCKAFFLPTGYWNFNPAQHALSWATQVFNDALIYCILFPPLALRIITISWSSRTILYQLKHDRRLVFQPLPDDENKGIGSIANIYFYMSLTLLVCVIYLAVLFIFFSKDTWIVMISTPLYLILFIGGFVMIFWPAHDAMKAAKKEEVKAISEQYNRRYNMLKNNSSRTKGYPEGEAKLFAELMAIHKNYLVVKNMHEWPFNIMTRIKLSLTPMISLAILLIKISLTR